MDLSNPGGYLNAVHLPQSIPKFAENTASAAVDGTIRITNIAFRFRAADVPPSLIRAYIRAKGGNIWQLDLGSVPSGGWHSLSVPVKHSAGWFKGPISPRSRFLKDVSEIDTVGVTIRRHSSAPAQNFGIDDFTIYGLRVGEGDTDGDGMPDDWEERHALAALDPGDRNEDADDDGMSNYAEYLAGTSPRDPLSTLQVDIESASEAPRGIRLPVTLRWQSTSNRTYSIWQTADLKDIPFELLETGIVATPPENEYTDAGSSNRNSGFYRVGVEE
jgi:hypothetical protein